MSLFWHVPGFPGYKYDTREGDTQFFLHYDDKTGKRKILVIDGGTPTYFNILYRDLLLFGASTPDSEIRIAASHAHYDHLKGLRNNKGSDYVRSAINAMWDMINEAKARGIKVVFLNNKQTVVWGDIKFQNFREQPSRVADDDKYGDSYLNDGSLCFWFWEQRYLTTGNGHE